MKKYSSMLTVVLALLMVVTASAQNPNYNNGPVWRVTYVHINPGQGDAFWKDVHDNLKPIWEGQKQAGIISDYKLWVNPTTDNPQDWSVALGILYPNWAGLDTADSKSATISAQHYGSRDAMMAAGKKRAEYMTVTASKLAREVTLK